MKTHRFRTARVVLPLACLGLLALPGAGTAQEKHAVFVGINDYIAFEDEPGGDLQGAERDAQLMRDVLTARWGLRDENVLMLLSRDATKDAIHEAITGWLAERAGPDDVAIFYFAGHGSQAYDLDGEEPDGLDETLAPTDIMVLSTERDIRDDELRQWLSAIGSQVIVILDSCHSGTATRGVSSMRARSLDRAIPSEGGREPERVRQAYDPESMADGGTSIIELAAAAPNQSAMEGDFGGVEGEATEPRGAFTYHLVRKLWQAPASTTYQALLDQLVSNLKADQFTQDPQLHGVATGPLFGTGSAQAKAIGLPAEPTVAPGSLDVVAIAGSVATLSGGELHGVTAASRYRTTGGAVLEVRTVDSDRATLTIVSGTPRVGESALPVAVALPTPELRVDGSGLPEDLLGPLVAAVSARELILFATEDQRSSDGFVRLSDDGASVEVLGRDGGARATVRVARDMSATISGVVAALDKERAIKQLAVLRNPAATFEVAVSAAWRSESAGRGVVTGARDVTTLRATVVSDNPGFLTLVNVAPGGSVSVHRLQGAPRGGPGAGAGRVAAGDSVIVDLMPSMDGEAFAADFGFLLALVTPEPLAISGPTDPEARSDRARQIRDALAVMTTRTDSASKWASRLAAYRLGGG